MTALAPDLNAACNFLEIHRPSGPWVLTAITPDGPISTETFFRLDAAATWIARQNADRNIYVMVAEAAGTLRKKAEKSDVKLTRHLWADADGGGDLDSHMNGHVPPPTTIVASGGGLNVYWALSRPLDSADTIEAHNKWLAVELGADHCWNCDRILRLPGTINWPNAKKKRQGRVPILATCIGHYPDRVYDLADFGRAEVREAKNANAADLGDDIQSLTLDDLPADVRAKVTATAGRLIREGLQPDEYRDDRSKAVWAVTHALVRADATDAQIAGILLNQDLPIHAHVRDQKGHGPRAYVVRQIERARERVATDADTQRLNGQPGAEDNWQERLEEAIAELNKRFFVASMGGSTRVASVQRDEALDRDRLVFTGERDIRLKYGNRHYKTGVTQRGYDIVEELGEAWLHHRQRRTYDQIALIPSGPCPPDVYNLWRGFGVEPKAGSWTTIEAHLRAVICSGDTEHYAWLIGWLAYCVQRPGRHAETAVVLRGLKGTGKGMVGQMLMRIFRGHGLHISHSKHLVGHFNAHLVDALFLFLDEAYWAGDKQGEGVRKALITEPTVMIEPKGVDQFPMANRLKILMASNNDWVVPASPDERRYFVLDVPDTRKGDRAYFSLLAAAIEGDELPALLDHLLNLEITDFDHRNPPHTEGLNRQKLIGGDSLQKFWADCLTMSTIVNAEIDDDWPESVRCSDLYNAYVEHAHDHGDRHPLTDEQMGVRLRKLCPDGVLKVIRPRTQDGAELRPRHFALNSLDAHREAFLRAMNIAQHDWPDT